MPTRLHFGEIIIPLGATPEGVDKAISEAERLREIVRRHGGDMDEGQSVKALLHVRGFDEWEQLCISLSDVPSSEIEHDAADRDEFDDSEKVALPASLTQMSFSEIGMRIKDHAIDLRHMTEDARGAQKLAERVAIELRNSPDTTRAIDTQDMRLSAKEIAWAGGCKMDAAGSLMEVLKHRDINIVRSAGERLDIEPSAKHPAAGPEWLPCRDIGATEELDMGPMAFIARQEDDDVPMLRMLHARGSQCVWVNDKATLTEDFLDLVAAYTGFRSNEPYRSAVDYLRRALFQWDNAFILDKKRPIRPIRRLIVSVPWHPHDDATAIYLEKAYRAGIDLVIRMTPAKHRRAQNAYARELIGMCRHIALGPRTVLPPFVPMDMVANHSTETVFTTAPTSVSRRK